MNEDLGAQFQHEGQSIYKSKQKRKESYSRNNARNRDEYSRTKAMGRTVDITEEQAFQYWEENYLNNNFESELIDKIKVDNNDDILSIEEYEKLKDNLTEEAKRFYKDYYKLAE